MLRWVNLTEDVRIRGRRDTVLRTIDSLDASAILVRWGHLY